MNISLGGIRVSILLGLLFWISVFVAPITFLYAIFKRSWIAMLVCFIAILPACLYFLSGEPPISYVGYLPIILLILVIFFYKKSRVNR